MILGLFRRTANEAVIDRLYDGLVAASRRPGFYAGLGVPDTFEGRFECLTLHAVLVLRRLQGAEAPGPEMAQHLIDTIFRHFDRTLREMGVGDMSVPKRMRSLAEAFLGRSAAYDEALRKGGHALEETLSRNILSGHASASGLAEFVTASDAAMATQPLQGFIDGHLPFPDPAVLRACR